MTRAFQRRVSVAGSALMILACGCVIGGDHEDDNEVISRVELTFTQAGGGDVLTFAFSDPDGDGGMSGIADPIELQADTEYSLELRFLNDLADPAEDITEVVRVEAEEHFVFILAEGLTHGYADLESYYDADASGDDLPVGLLHTISTGAAGPGTLRIMLRHLPELNGEPQKTGDLPQRFTDGEALPGNADVDVSFELTLL